MRLPRFHIQTLMIAVAVVAVLLWAGLLALEYEGLLVLIVFMALPVGYLATCVSLVIGYRNV